MTPAHLLPEREWQRWITEQPNYRWFNPDIDRERDLRRKLKAKIKAAAREDGQPWTRNDPRNDDPWAAPKKAVREAICPEVAELISSGIGAKCHVE